MCEDTEASSNQSLLEGLTQQGFSPTPAKSELLCGVPRKMPAYRVFYDRLDRVILICICNVRCRLDDNTAETVTDEYQRTGIFLLGLIRQWNEIK
jgi:hypothetical protein